MVIQTLLLKYNNMSACVRETMCVFHAPQKTIFIWSNFVSFLWCILNGHWFWHCWRMVLSSEILLQTSAVKVCICSVYVCDCVCLSLMAYCLWFGLNGFSLLCLWMLWNKEKKTHIRLKKKSKAAALHMQVFSHNVRLCGFVGVFFRMMCGVEPILLDKLELCGLFGVPVTGLSIARECFWAVISWVKMISYKSPEYVGWENPVLCVCVFVCFCAWSCNENLKI